MGDMSPEQPTVDPSGAEPLYEQLARIMANQMAAGQWPSGGQLPRERDLERQYGVSRQTVRTAMRALEVQGLIRRVRGKGTFVAPGGDVPRGTFSLADALLLIQINAGDVVGPYFAAIQKGVSHAARAAGFKLRIEQMFGHVMVPQKSHVAPDSAETRGVILFGTFDMAYMQMLTSTGLPLVVVDYRARDQLIDSVGVDVEGEACLALEYLASLGHRTVGVVAAGRDDPWGVYDYDPDVWLFLNALRREAMDYGIQVRSEWILTPSRLGEPLTDAVNGLLAMQQRPTAIICFDYVYAPYVMAAMDRVSLSAPRDLSLICRGHIAAARASSQDLTYLESSPELLGQTAVRLLAERIRGRRQRAVRLSIASRLVMGGSTGAPPDPVG